MSLTITLRNITDMKKLKSPALHDYHYEVFVNTRCIEQGYVRGHAHTNGLENFWSLLKRGINGTYVSVEPFHLFRYLDEQTFRYNERDDNDAGRFRRVLNAVVGKRLTYRTTRGKTAKSASA